MATLSADITLTLRSFDLDLKLEVDRTVAVIGPSGAGKTSVLRSIAGLARPKRGRVALDRDVWFDADRRLFKPPNERRVGLVFQEYALFPHMTVRQNISYAGKARTDEFLERFRIQHLADERPTELSGGERQRVALARALARDPGVLLLDEPLAALDANTKMTVRGELHELLHELALPTVLVTHDWEDAAALADQVGVIVEGRLRQLATPDELVANPADTFVASFTGANLLHGQPGGAEANTTRVRLEDGTVISTTDHGEGAVTLAVYPWDVTISRTRPDDSATNVIAGSITAVTELGNRARVTIGPLSAEITVDSLRRLGLEPGQQAFASFKATGTRIVASKGGTP